ncbi:collagen alpha-2(IX) chain-like [Penaeus monodon]|uniref:collagen alpha-2(IX) chain-like n=1 Tax=Penaeus monodon TaxID=6687 RepID=UPI0018A77497|nr:collagen alpha-2(IX) chain-like [Penaeus monodon]
MGVEGRPPRGFPGSPEFVDRPEVLVAPCGSTSKPPTPPLGPKGFHRGQLRGRVSLGVPMAVFPDSQNSQPEGLSLLCGTLQARNIKDVAHILGLSDRESRRGLLATGAMNSIKRKFGDVVPYAEGPSLAGPCVQWGLHRETGMDLLFAKPGSQLRLLGHLVFPCGRPCHQGSLQNPTRGRRPETTGDHGLGSSRDPRKGNLRPPHIRAPGPTRGVLVHTPQIRPGLSRPQSSNLYPGSTGVWGRGHSGGLIPRSSSPGLPGSAGSPQARLDSIRGDWYLRQRGWFADYGEPADQRTITLRGPVPPGAVIGERGPLQSVNPELVARVSAPPRSPPLPQRP